VFASSPRPFGCDTCGWKKTKKAVSWCAHGPVDYVNSPVDGRTTPHVHDAAVGAKPRGHARQKSGVVHRFPPPLQDFAESIAHAGNGVKFNSEKSEKLE
jgi:hypothetical protein